MGQEVTPAHTAFLLFGLPFRHIRLDSLEFTVYAIMCIRDIKTDRLKGGIDRDCVNRRPNILFFKIFKKLSFLSQTKNIIFRSTLSCTFKSLAKFLYHPRWRILDRIGIVLQTFPLRITFSSGNCLFAETGSKVYCNVLRKRIGIVHPNRSWITGTVTLATKKSSVAD